MDLATLAQYAGVSKATASRAFKEGAPIKPEVRVRIRALAKELGYRPNIVAQSLIKGTEHHIGLIVAQREPIPSKYTMMAVGETICAMSDVLEHKGYNLIMATGNYTVAERPTSRLLPKMVDERHIAGLIVLMDIWPRLREEVEQTKLPCVAVDCPGIEGLPTIVVDEQGGVAMLTEYLIKLGHKRIAYIDSAIYPGNAIRTQDRPIGYLQAITKYGLAPIPGWDENVKLDDGLEHVFSLPAPPTAILVYDDMEALYTIRWLAKRGLKVPEDVSVASCQDMSLGEFTFPTITRLVPPHKELAEKSITLLLEIIDKKVSSTEDINLTLSPKLVKGESTKKIEDCEERT